MLKSIFDISYFARKTFAKKEIFKKFRRSVISYWVVVLISFWPVLRYLSVLSKKPSLATLVNKAKVRTI